MNTGNSTTSFMIQSSVRMTLLKCVIFAGLTLASGSLLNAQTDPSENGDSGLHRDGDMNNDGKIKVGDDVNLVSRIGNLVVGRTDLTGCAHYDLNYDGVINTDDMAILIGRVVISEDSVFPLPMGEPQPTEAYLYCTIGDYFVNGIVDQDDFHWWIKHTAGLPFLPGEIGNRGKLYTDGDCNGDGLVDENDLEMIFQLWLRSNQDAEAPEAVNSSAE